MYFKDVAK